MIQANLIPIPRRLARQRRTRVRRWVSVCTVYSVMLVGAYGALNAVWGHSDEVFEHDVVTVTNDISVTEKEVKQVQPKLNDARLTLAASLAVGSQPDWSVLLALLAKQMRDNDTTLREAARQAGVAAGMPIDVMIAPVLDDVAKQIVLSSCEMEPVRDVAPAALPGAPGNPGTPGGPAASANLVPAQPTYTLFLTGMGRSQGAISQYVLRLEQTGLFDRVTLIESKRAPFGEAEAVAFRIGCTLGERK